MIPKVPHEIPISDLSSELFLSEGLAPWSRHRSCARSGLCRAPALDNCTYPKRALGTQY